MADTDLSISQLPPLALPVQASDLLHISRGGDDFRISRAELVKMLLSQLSDANISGATSGQALVYNSASGKWANGFVSWATVSGKPGTFPPTAHTHLWDEITDAPTSFPVEPHSHAWAELTDVPSMFPPEEHDHSVLYYSKTELGTPYGGAEVSWWNITDVPDLGEGAGDMSKSVYDQDDDGIVDLAANALNVSYVWWGSIEDIPTEFPPSAHTHDDRYFTEDELTTPGGGGSVHWNNVTGKPSVSGDMRKSVYDSDDDGIVDHAMQAESALMAGGVDWSAVLNIPADFPPSAHNHNDLYSLLAHPHAGIVASQIASAPWVTGIELTTLDRLGIVINSSGVLKALAVDELAEWMKIANLNYVYAAKTHTHASYLTDAPSDTKTYGRKNGAWAEVVASAGGAWGSITGTLSSQADLQTALDGKSATSHDHNSLYSVLAHSHDHRTLSYVGSNTHDAIDLHISNAAPHSGHSVVGHQHTSREILVMHGNSTALASGATQYLCPGLLGLVALNGAPLPFAGTIKNLTVKTNSTQPASGTLVFTVQKGAVDQAVVVTVPINGGANSYSDTSHSVSWIAGEVLGIKIKNNATASSATVSGVTVEFQVATI